MNKTFSGLTSVKCCVFLITKPKVREGFTTVDWICSEKESEHEKITPRSLLVELTRGKRWKFEE